MFHGRNQNECFLLNYLHVLRLCEVSLPLEYHLPNLRLLHHLAKHVGVVADDALEMRLVVQVLETIFADRFLHSRRMLLSPLLARGEVLHTDIMYHFIISRTSNECVVLRNAMR